MDLCDVSGVAPQAGELPQFESLDRDTTIVAYVKGGVLMTAQFFVHPATRTPHVLGQRSDPHGIGVCLFAQDIDELGCGLVFGSRDQLLCHGGRV